MFYTVEIILQDVPCFLVENPKYTEDAKQIDNIYTEIPSPFLKRTKMKTLELCDHITENFDFRYTTGKKSVLFICIIMLAPSVKSRCYVHLINLMEIPYSGTNRGMVFPAFPREARLTYQHYDPHLSFHFVPYFMGCFISTRKYGRNKTTHKLWLNFRARTFYSHVCSNPTYFHVSLNSVIFLSFLLL